jgi:NAD(P)H dehydrogenase (quinone)
MGKILVTGASGDLGRKTVLHLLKRKSAGDVAALARDPAKAADLLALGIEVRQGDYMDRASLKRSFDGIEKLMLTATHAFTDRNTAHGNVIEEAVRAGVEHLVFMPIHRKRGSTFTMKEITAEDIFTVEKLRSSGLTYTLAEHPPFLDILAFYIGANAHQTGVRVPPGNGKFGAATRGDLAEAHAAILAGKGHENKTYSLTGNPAVSFADIADILSKVTGTKVPFVQITDEEFLASKRPAGLPESVIEFALRWVQGMNAGEWQGQTGDLEALIGRKPTTAFEFFRDDFLDPTDARNVGRDQG